MSEEEQHIDEQMEQHRQSDPMDEAIRNAARIADANHETRVELVNKLKKFADSMEIDWEKDKAGMIEAKLLLIDKINSLMSQDEMASDRSAKLRLKKKEAETDEKSSEMVVELLRQIDNNTGSGGGTIPGDEVDREIEQRYEKDGVDPIKDGETRGIEEPGPEDPEAQKDQDGEDKKPE